MKFPVNDMPKGMRTLERDPRGYPIPFIVLRDKLQRPIFTVNDTLKVRECERKGLCGVCGKLLLRAEGSIRPSHREMWFVGGTRAFIHQHGAFIDPPVHYQCGAYAMKVCPFLATRAWNKSIAANQLKENNHLPDNMTYVDVGHAGPMHPEFFALGMATQCVRTPENNYWIPSFHYIEFWRNGEQVNAPTADEVRMLQNVRL